MRDLIQHRTEDLLQELHRRGALPPPPVRFTPVAPDTPQDAFAKALAAELTADGVDACGALPTVVGYLAGVQAALAAGDLAAGVEALAAARREADRWWVKHHPKSTHAAAARERLSARGAGE